MADKDYSQLTSGTPGSDDLLAFYPVAGGGGPLKKITYGNFTTAVANSVAGTYLTVASNLSDLASPSTARANLGLGSAALLNSGAIFQVANNFSEVANATSARNNLGAAAKVSPTITGGMTFDGCVACNVQAVAATTLDVSVSEFQTKSISGSTTFTLSGATSGRFSAMILQLTTSSNAQPTFTGARWSNGAAPTLANGIHKIGLIYDGATWAAVLLSTAEA